MGLTKKIAFDENSMPPKDQIWYRGEGKFYEYKDGKWVLAYDLAGTPSQEELDSIANVIEEKTGKTLEDKSLQEILGAIVDAIPSGEMPRPIVLTAEPSSDDTIETLAAKGLTLAEIQAATQGERTCVVLNKDYYSILSAYYAGSDLCGIVFASVEFGGNGEASVLSQYSISIDSEGATVTFTEV